jgi:hypothetical protein
MLRTTTDPLLHPPVGGLSRRAFLHVAIASVGVAYLAPSIALAEGDGWKGILGAFKFAGGKDEEQARLRAIDEIVGRMTPIARGIARSKLGEATAIAQRVSLAVDGRLLTVANETRSDTAPTDGSTVKVTAFNGDEMDLSYKLKGTEILQSFTDGSKGSVHSFALADEKLVVRHAIYASQLPGPVLYRTTYARA